jgi:MFS family permease
MDPSPAGRPTRVRYGVLGFAAALSMITYLDRVCFGTVGPLLQSEFGLDDRQLGALFTAFTLAYAAFEVPSGWMGDVFGPRRVLIRIVLWWSAFTALTGAVHPSAAYPWLPFGALLLVRFLFGMGEAGAYPNIARAFHNWFPLQERGFAQGAVWMAGRFAGGATGFVVLALLYRTPAAERPEALPALGAGVAGAAAPGGGGPFAALAVLEASQVTHWRHAFWIFGALGVLWCLAFAWWFRDRPEQHAWVNDAELALIRGGRAGAVPVGDFAKEAGGGASPAGGPAGEAGGGDEPSHAGVPWARLALSGNLWLLCLQYFCASFGWYFNITWLPKYLKEHHGVTQEAYGYWTVSLMTGAPLLLGSLACLVGGLLTDAFIRRTGDRKWGRRLFGVAGHGACAACYFLAAFAASPWPFVLAVALAAFCNDLTMGSAWASCLDIGRRYSGIVAGCMNTVGNLGGALAGVTTGWVLHHFSANNGWPTGYGWSVNIVSYAAVYVLAAGFWLGFDATRPVAPEG